MNNLSSGNRFFFVKNFKGKFYPDSLLRPICENRQKLYSCRLRVNNQVITDYTIQDPTQSSMDQSIHWDKKEEQTNVLIQSGTFSLETRKIKSFECLDPIKCIVHVTWNEISLALSVAAVLTSVYMSIELPRHQNELLAFYVSARHGYAQMFPCPCHVGRWRRWQWYKMAAKPETTARDCVSDISTRRLHIVKLYLWRQNQVFSAITWSFPKPNHLYVNLSRT